MQHNIRSTYKNSYTKSRKNKKSLLNPVLSLNNFFYNKKYDGFLRFISYMSYFSGDNLLITVPQARLADYLQKNIRTIRRYVRKAKDLELITIFDKGISGKYNKGKTKISTYLLNPVLKNKKLLRELYFLTNFHETPDDCTPSYEALKSIESECVLSIYNIRKEYLFNVEYRLKLEEQFRKEQNIWKARECFLNAKSRFDLETASVCPRPQVRSVCPRSQNIFSRKKELGIVVPSQKQAKCPPEFPSFLDSS